MMRKFVAATTSAVLCLMSVTPAMAQNYRFSGFDAPRGATATANLVVPLGHDARKSKTSYGLTLGYGHTVAGPDLDGRTTSRAMKFADIRFADGFKLQKAEVATFNLANLEEDRRMKMMGGAGMFTIIGIAAVAVGICLLADCFEDDDDNIDADVED